jgi:hypothetical protein
MSATPPPVRHPYGLPMGTVRGFLSVLICSFFWIFLLLPEPPPDQGPLKAPLGHFFLLTLVFLAFASQPTQELRTKAFLPWLMRVIFIGGSAAVLIYVGITNPARLADRLTPAVAEISEWPVLLGCLAGGFGSALFIRFVLGRNSELFMTIRAWVGILAMLLLLSETIFQFIILPTMTNKPGIDTLQVWEGILIAAVAAYFGARA